MLIHWSYNHSARGYEAVDEDEAEVDSAITNKNNRGNINPVYNSVIIESYRLCIINHPDLMHSQFHSNLLPVAKFCKN